ncbi:MFS transporter [Propylenella binzhouense]|uniref:MFS transporter n=1 Tax=Propylenella binzhouense TaxID=2555902 RepID=A0A964T6Y4_9HYPH|nr:MFS transporter [Propylenella binzhouense]MYZ49681.1 MFS transporter [Propylenella binzhouense]
MSSPAEAPDERWAAFRNVSFVRYWVSRFAATFAVQLQSVAVGWYVYDLTRDPFHLGLVGLVQFLPSLLLVLVTGTVADRYRRRTIMGICLIVEGICSATLLAFVVTGLPEVWPIFVVLAIFGIARAFYAPAVQSLLPNLVAPEHLANAVAWNSSSWQVANILGPVVGGLLYGVAAEVAFGTGLALFVGAGLLTMIIPRPAQRIAPEPANWHTIVAGFQYIWHEKVVLGAVSLDLFAVLLGGATALLPVYARDILELGPWGLGLLRGAPGAGALLTAVWLAIHPVRDHAGLLMFVFVGLFGVCVTAFGFSTVPAISILALLLMGACDMVSVYIRETLIQLWTPDSVRGRVNAVNMVFIGASNELGEFRAGMMAALIGTKAAVAFGGLGTVAVAALWARMFPALRQARHLSGRV